ncbi:hypothetical protein ZOSMA_90G00160 [Zostera marina]|uniref:Uncharacterized protein n=1 Tax=Zostera marina TaxID=29655 RepID=A0A0K9NJ91_ZOSMR|nr:hypothetical protein ZOSMA_90G00110 [Zostera marina]KMZ56846.1 hypothetical protein ZOSMA_90G00160 [Zostera marina]
MMINSIQVQYIKDGKLTWTDEVSKNGFRKEIVLEDGLTEVRGYYGVYLVWVQYPNLHSLAT